MKVVRTGSEALAEVLLPKSTPPAQGRKSNWLKH
jgi:hypothetical protein